MSLCFQTFRLQPPHAPPLSGFTSCSGQAWPPIRPGGQSAVIRTSILARNLISRIRPYRVCVAMLGIAVLRTIRSRPVALHAESPGRSYFPLPGGKRRQRGTFTLRTRSLSSARAGEVLLPTPTCASPPVGSGLQSTKNFVGDFALIDSPTADGGGSDAFAPGGDAVRAGLRQSHVPARFHAMVK